MKWDAWDKLKPDDWQSFAAGWLQELKGPKSDEEDSLGQKVVLMNFTASAAAQWQFILAAIDQAQSDDELGHVAAGPLEHLLGWHGIEFIERVEQQAALDSKFARTITGVWRYKMTDEIWSRVEAIQQSVPDPLQFS